jgi:hypothetical protein
VGPSGRAHPGIVDRSWRLALAALVAASALAGRADDVPDLALPTGTPERLELLTLIFPREPPARLLHATLRISGIDPEEVRRTLEEVNRSSELAQFTPDGLAVAPYLLQRALSLDRDQLLQVRWSGRTARLVFRFTWR